MKLYEIAKEVEAALEAGVDPETGELDSDAMVRIQRLEGSLEAKSLDIAAYVKGLLAESTALRVEARGLTDRARASENRAAGLQRYLAVWIPPGTRYADSRSQIAWRRSVAVEIQDEAALPEPFWRVKREPNREELRQALKDGTAVPGAVLVERNNLVIR